MKGVRVVECKQKHEKEKIVTDPLGSYTGNPVDKGEKPVQDADDL